MTHSSGYQHIGVEEGQELMHPEGWKPIAQRCIVCERNVVSFLPEDEALAFLEGRDISKVKALTVDERDILLTDICSPCYDAVYPEEGEGIGLSPATLERMDNKIAQFFRGATFNIEEHDDATIINAEGETPDPPEGRDF